MSQRKWLAVALLALGYGAWVQAFASVTLPPRTHTQKLLGPASELLADMQWIRFTRARVRGEHDRALGFAESALALDPTSTDGWEYLATHLSTFHASPEREPDVARRNAWFDAGLEVTRRGAEQATDPGRLALTRALLCVNRAQVDPLSHPGGQRALLEEALDAASSARNLGAFGAAEIVGYLEEELRR